jgi:competence protein ComEA
MKSRILILAGALAVALPLVAFADETAPAKPATTPAHHSSGSHASSSAPKVNLNTASKEELTKLPGVTDEIADKIIAARPFKSRSELVDKKIVTKEEYEKVHNMVSAKASTSSSTAHQEKKS